MKFPPVYDEISLSMMMKFVAQHFMMNNRHFLAIPHWCNSTIYFKDFFAATLNDTMSDCPPLRFSEGTSEHWASISIDQSRLSTFQSAPDFVQLQLQQSHA